MLYTITLVFFGLLMIIDSVTTYKIISSGGYEMNPIVSTFMKHLGATAGITTVKVGAFGFIYWINPPILILWILVTVYIWVCWHNIKQLG